MKRIAVALWLGIVLTGCAATPNRPPEVTAAGGIVYPEQARQQKVEGWVRVAYDVTVDGSVANARVVESDPKGVFDEAALTAVRTWKFHPAVKNGKIVETKDMISRVNFKLGESESYAR